MIVWMKVLRRGISYHHLRTDEPTKTVCGRFAGRPDNPRGHLLGRQEARDRYNSPECGHCSGAWDRCEPLSARRRAA